MLSFLCLRRRVPASLCASLLVFSAVISARGQSAASLDHTAEALDSALALAPANSDDARVYLGCQGYRVDTLRAWRDQIETARAALAKTGNANLVTAQRAFASTSPANLWTGGVVPYVFDAAVTTAQRAAFLDGAGEWNAFANVTFVPRVAQTDYVLIRPYAFSGGRADVGRIGGQQIIELGDWERSVIVHEIGHCLGLIHEHQRPDRDSFVTINFANVTPGSELNFVLLPTAVTQGGYDFESTMHYQRFSNAIDPAVPTIQPLPAYAAFIAILDGGTADRALSAGDRASMAPVYGAPLIAPSAIVTNTRDSGPGSLRTAIYYAWDHPGTAVTFNIPVSDSGFAGGVFTIRPTDVMTRLAPTMTIDGATQTAFTGNTNTAGPEVVLSGSAIIPGGRSGLHLFRGGITVRSLVLRDFGGPGLRFRSTDSTGNTVAGCYIGTDHTGTVAAPNGGQGAIFEFGAHANTLGGTTAGAGNVISGNVQQGIALTGTDTDNNVIAGNRIGTNAAGTAAIPNGSQGVQLWDHADGNIIGGSTAAARNLISGHPNYGILVNTCDATRIEGNYIGTNLAGTAALPNNWVGVALYDSAAGSVVRGNVVSGNGNYGIVVDHCPLTTLAGNFVGTNAAGSAALANGWSGVAFYNACDDALVGGTTAADRNVISGNANHGLILDSATDAIVAGNFIGLDATGTTAIANGWSGLMVQNGSNNTLIGGTSAAARNVISGNTGMGVFVSFAQNTRIEGNYLGTDVTGALARPNLDIGVGIFGAATGTRLGGSTPGAGNIISGNSQSGVRVAGSGTTDTIVAGNRIGVNAAGTAALPNGFDGLNAFDFTTNVTIGGTAPGARNWISGNNGFGITLSGQATGVVIQNNAIGERPDGVSVGNSIGGIGVWDGAHDNLIGGGSGAGNTIRGNAGDGIRLYEGQHQRIAANRIFENTWSGIAVYSGANGDLQAPNLTDATLGTTVHVTGNIYAPSAGTYRVEIFANPVGSAFPGALGQGKTFLGAGDFTVAAGAPAFVLDLPSLVPAGSVISATATDSAGNTSAFAMNVVLTTTDSDNDGLPDAYETANSFNPASAADATLDTDGDGFTNLQEFYAGTNPRSAASKFGPLQITTAAADTLVTLPAAVAGKTYRVETRADLLSGSWQPLASGLWRSTAGPLSITDTGATSSATKRFYRFVTE